jgi:cytochrome P450
MLRILMLLYSAGLHTTTSTIGNMVAYPEQQQRLGSEPEAIPRAIEEMMTWESIVSVRRTPLTDVTIGDRLIRAGEPIVLFLGSAGRDDSVFSEPDQVDFDRSDNRHINFGVGPHRCLGSHLARMELRVALEEITRILPDYRIDRTRPFRRHTGVERGVDELWVTTGA